MDRHLVTSLANRNLETKEFQSIQIMNQSLTIPNKVPESPIISSQGIKMIKELDLAEIRTYLRVYICSFFLTCNLVLFVF